MKEPTYLVPFDFADRSLLLPFSKGRWFPGGEFTKEDGEEVVENFKSNILERTEGKLPINAEHNRGAGLIGYVTDVELGDDGVYGTYEWEDKVKAKKFDYTSAEIKWAWKHPFKKTEHKNVLMGVGITNYPRLLGQTAIARFSEDGGWEFAQESGYPIEDSVWDLRGITDAMFMLRSLRGFEELKSDAQLALDSMKRLASSVVSAFAGDGEEEETPEKVTGKQGRETDTQDQDFKEEEMELDNEKVAQGIAERLREIFKPAEPKTDPVSDKAQENFSEQLTEMQTQMAALTEQMAAKDTEITALSQAKEEADQKVQEYSDKATEAETQRRMAEFAETATKWGVPMKASDFAETLMLFNDADETEDKKHYTRLVAIVEALGNQTTMAALFSEKGTNATGPASDADKVDALIQQRRTEFSEDVATATASVIALHPELYQIKERASDK